MVFIYTFVMFISDKYPEIKQLYGVDPNFKWIVSALVIFQLLTLFVVQHLSWPTLLIVAYCFGGVINHTLMLGKAYVKRYSSAKL